MRALTTPVSHFLDELTGPLFDKHIRFTTIIDGVNLIIHLETFSNECRLKPTSRRSAIVFILDQS
jgi:hypothetical protein